MTSNKYATLRATIARAKRHDCQKVVMRVTLAEEILDQLSNAEKQIAELAAENAGLKAAKEIIRHLNVNREEANFCGIDDCYIDDAVAAMITPATDDFLAEVRAQGVEMFASVLESRGRHQDYVEIANAYAAQLRKGVQS
ncbi:hypothetical protein LJT59_002077 [Escherichia coli]|nr:hypothetical protein [Escherichia coli]